MRKIIHTESAPSAIGNYSQAVMAGKTLYLSGQIPLDPKTMTLVDGDIQQQVDQVFTNIKQVIEAAHGNLQQVVKLTVYLTDLANMPAINDAIARYFTTPYPARTSIQISALPKNAAVEVEAIAVIE